MLSDYEFAKEYVARIKRPAGRAIEVHLIKIVEQGQRVPLNKMHNDEFLAKWAVWQVPNEVYCFVRDNQHLFVKE